MNRIKERRLELGYTQEHLAIRASTKQQRIYEWEKGIKAPGLHSLTKLALALDTTIDDLVNREE